MVLMESSLFYMCTCIFSFLNLAIIAKNNLVCLFFPWRNYVTNVCRILCYIILKSRYFNKRNKYDLLVLIFFFILHMVKVTK